MGDGGGDLAYDFGDVEGFGKEVADAEAAEVGGRGIGGIAAHEEKGEARADGEDALGELEAAEAGHVEIGEDGVEAPGGVDKEVEGLVGAGVDVGGEAVALEESARAFGD